MGIVNLRSELESVRNDLTKSEDIVKRKDAEMTKIIHKDNDAAIVENLRNELMASKSRTALLKEQLDSSKISNWNNLIDVATSREKVRHLEDDLEELEEKINGDHQEVIDVDRKHDNEKGNDSSRKRAKTRTGNDDDDSDDNEDDDDDDDDAI